LYNCQWSDIVAAVQRNYESVHRQWKMEEKFWTWFWWNE